MDVRKTSWARPLALLLALTMIMMYSLGGAVFAAQDTTYKVTYSSHGPKAADYPSGTTVTVGPAPDGYGWQLNGNDTDLGPTNGTIYAPGDTFTMPANTINFKIIKLDGTPAYDLLVTKSADNTSIIMVGDTVTYSIEVTNDSEESVTGVKVAEDWPLNLSMSAITTPGETTYADGIWDIGNLGAGERITLLITAVAIDAGASVENTVTVSFDGTDYNTSNDTASETISIAEYVPNSDLNITKIADDDALVIGESVEFTIVVTNNGPDMAEDVVVEETWPTGLSISGVSVDGEPYEMVGNQIQLGDMADEAKKTIIITAVTTLVDPKITNTVYVSSDVTDLNTADNTASETISVTAEYVPKSDLSITKIADDDTLTVGDEVTFDMVIENIGPDAAQNVVVNEAWPAGLSISAVTTNNATPYDLVNDQLLIGNLASGATINLQITAIATTAAESITNTVTVTFGGVDLDLTNNTATDSVKVSPQQPDPDFDIGVNKTVNPSSVRVGNSATFTITVTNNGDETVDNIAVEDTWPSGLDQGTATPQEGTTYSAVTGIWLVGSLTPGQSKTLTLVADTEVTGTYTNLVEIVVEEGVWNDDNAENDSDTATLSVTRPSTGGGSTTTTPTPPVVEITDPEPPLAEVPEVEEPVTEEPVLIEEAPVPLADVPQTSDSNNIFLLIMLMMASGAGIITLGRRKETVEK